MSHNNAVFEELGLCGLYCRDDLTHEHVREVFECCPLTGKIYWRIRLNRNIRIGQEAGTPTNDGYVAAAISGFKYARHRLVYMWAHGALEPSVQIDHINRVRGDDRIWNLRTATGSQNRLNACLRSDNKSGYRGVYWRKVEKKWHACLMVGGKKIYLGFHDSPEAAHSEYLKAVSFYRPEDINFLPALRNP
jgi:hypothetical protein